MKEITVQELKNKMDEGQDFQLIDVREPTEYEIANLNGELIPMGEIIEKTENINKDKPVVVYCRSGNRSANVVKLLETKYGFDNLYNLKGGITAWAKEIDPSMPVY
jgi:sulfur-carrier protein adenylyltransferase/sulfurtransferase